MDSRHRKYLLTINNPGDEWEHDKIREALGKLRLKYWCMADEVGLQEHTPHTHVFFVAENAVRFSTVKKLFPTAHIDPAQGTSEENRNYIRKEGEKWAEKAESSIPGTFEEYGIMPLEHPGQRTDWDIAYDMLEDGTTVLDVIRSQTHLMRYRSALEQVRQDLIAEEYRTQFRKMEVTYISGETARGKTRYVMDKYGYEKVCQITDYQHGCFDKYQCEDVLLLDEFSSSIKIQDMNNLLDGYPLMLPCRYANRVACFTKVYMISNIPLELQYPHIQIANPTVWNAFLRRIHRVMVFYDYGKYREYTTQEYFKCKNPPEWVQTEVEDMGDKDIPF